MNYSEQWIGIDLGSASCSVGIWRNNKVEIIPNRHSYKLTPSYVSFTENGILVGDDSKKRASFTIETTVFAVQRMLGRRFDDPFLQNLLKGWPFDVKEGRNSEPLVSVWMNGNEKLYCVEEILGMMLRFMKEIAEDYIGQKVCSAVVTIPAYYNNSQKQSIIDALTISGITKNRLLYKSTALALFYGYTTRPSYPKTVLSLDLGNGSTSVSLLTICGMTHTSKSVSGSTTLGYEDLSMSLLIYTLTDFLKKTGRPLVDRKLIMKLRICCESAKKTLNFAKSAKIEIKDLNEGYEYFNTVTRKLFKKLNSEYFVGVIMLIEKTLRDSEVSKGSVHEIVLNGSGSMSLELRKRIQKFFLGKEPRIESEYASVYGTTILSASLSGF